MANEDEGWEVVKPTKLEPHHSPVKILTGSKAEVSTNSDEIVEKVSKHPLESHNILVETKSYATAMIPENVMDYVVDLFPHRTPLQNPLESIEYTQLLEQGTKCYYIVKRNLKTVSLLFLLSVFFANTVPSSRFKKDDILSSRPDATGQENGTKTEAGLLFELLKSQLEKIEETNRQLNRELSMAVYERNHWRSAALTCDQDLREVTASHSLLEEEVKQSKWLAPLSLASPVPPINATAIAASSHVPDYDELGAPEPSPAKRIPYPQLALPNPDPVQLLPMSSMTVGRGKPYSAVILAPSVAIMAV